MTQTLAYVSQRILDPTVMRQLYRYWRFRILATTLVGYAIFYFVRTNISLAVKPMSAELGYTKEQFGWIMTIGGFVYGVSKFANGFLGDRVNPRYFMAVGLFASAICNIFFGMSGVLWVLIGIWALNNWAQGMGFPPCARSMAHWFSPRERGTTFGIWHTGHMIGAALVSVLCGYLLAWYGEWRLCFYVPAAIAIFGAILIYVFLRDTPESQGLPPVEVYKGEESAAELREETHPQENYWQLVADYVFKNPYMWLISVANLLVYTLRYAALHWGPTLLQEDKHMTIASAGWMAFGFEMAGMVGALIAGVLSDRLFRGHAGRACMIAMFGAAAVIFCFWKAPVHSPAVGMILFISMGFFIYIPQMLIAVLAMHLGTKRVAAAAVGLTGFFGYASSFISGVGVGKIADTYGWEGAYVMLIGCALLTAIVFIFTWNVGAHPHLEKAH